MILKEYNINAADGVKLYSQTWEPEHPPKAVYAILHGLGEHSGRYRELANFLNKEGYAVSALDLRGHGLSEGQRGHAPSYDILMEDIALFLGMVSRLFPGIPMILLGHSLGGNLTLTYLIKRQPALAGAVITAPLLALPGGQKSIKKIVGKVLYELFPTFMMATGLETAALSRDINVVKAYQADPLVHDRISTRLGIDFLTYGAWLQTQTVPDNMRILVMQGSADRIISPEAVRIFCEKQDGNLTYKEWKGFFHEIHNELQKDDVFRELAQWTANILADAN